MSTLRALDASAEAADACERAAVALKRATRDVEASARGFGLEPNAVARARQLCAEVIRLASRADAAIAAAHDAAALEASKTIHDAFLTPAEDRAATRERLASGSTEPVRVQLVRFRKSGRSEAPIAFLFRRRRASFAGSGSGVRNDSQADEMMRSLLLEVREKLDAPTAVAGLYRADGARIVSPYAVRDGETLVAKMASDEMNTRDATRLMNTSRVSDVVSRLTAVNARRDSARAAPAYAVNATPMSRPSVSNTSPGGERFVRPGSAPARSASSPLKARQSAKDAELARPKPVWVRSFAVKLRVRHAGSELLSSRPRPEKKEKTEAHITMRVPEKGLEGMSMALLRRRVALACGLEPSLFSGAELTLRLSPGRTELRHPAELTPGCALDVLVDESASERKENVRTGGRGAKKNKNAFHKKGSTLLDFAPSSPAGKATRARVERLMKEEGARSIADADDDATSPFGPSRKRSSERNPYFVDPLAFADGRFDFSPAASSPRPPRKPDRFSMRKLTAKDLRRIRAPPASKSKPTPKPVVGEYSFGSRIRFDPAMLPPARRVAVAGDAAKKKKKKSSAVKKKTRAEAEPSVARSESFPVEKPSSPKNVEKPRDEREEEGVRVPVVAPAEGGDEEELLGPNALRSRRLPPKTPIWDPGLAAKKSDGEIAEASSSPRTNYPYAEAEDARAFFDALAAEPAAETPRES